MVSPLNGDMMIIGLGGKGYKLIIGPPFKEDNFAPLKAMIARSKDAKDIMAIDAVKGIFFLIILFY